MYPINYDNDTDYYFCPNCGLEDSLCKLVDRVDCYEYPGYGIGTCPRLWFLWQDWCVRMINGHREECGQYL